jgi:hypothetical protein
MSILQEIGYMANSSDDDADDCAIESERRRREAILREKVRASMPKRQSQPAAVRCVALTSQLATSVSLSNKEWQQDTAHTDLDVVWGD